MAPESAEIELFFDGKCPLCAREIAALRWLDRKRRVRFVDIAAPDFDALSYGKDLATFMGRIQARTVGRDSEWLDGVEVFRRVYGAVGMKWFMPLTRLPGLRQALERGYDWFAANRLRITGREAEVAALTSAAECTDRCVRPTG